MPRCRSSPSTHTLNLTTPEMGSSSPLVVAHRSAEPSANPHTGRGVVMQRLIRFRQRRVVLPDRDTVGPVGWTNCNITGVATKAASELRIPNHNEGTGFWYLIEVGNSLCLCVAVMHQPILAFEVRS